MILVSDYFFFSIVCLKQQPTDKPVPNATLQVTGAVGWRREGLVYKKNEVFRIFLLFFYIFIKQSTRL